MTLTVSGPELPSERSDRSSGTEPDGSSGKLRLDAPRRRALGMIAADVVSAFLALVAALASVRLVMPFSADWILGPKGLAGAAMLAATFGMFGLYSVPGYGPTERVRRRALGSAMFAMAVALTVEASNSWTAVLAFLIATFMMTITVGYFAQETLRRTLGPAGGSSIEAAIIGTSEAERRIASVLIEHPEIGIRPTGFLALPEQQTVGVELPLPLLGRLDGSSPSPRPADLAILVMPLAGRAEIEAKLGPLPFPSIATIKDVEMLHAHRLRPGPLLADPGAGMAPGDLPPMSGARRLIKRGLDIILTLPLALLSLPLLLIAIVMVRIIDPGHAIYVQQRVGLGGRMFGVLKIRTMYQDAEQRLERLLREDPLAAEQWRTHFKLDNDPRILPVVGNVLRRFSVDELPQVWNVLRGDMSLVGPRPFPVYHLDGFDPEFREVRQTVVPGLTGLWQISTRSDGDLAQQKELDLLYIRNWSLWLDLQILLQTLPAVIGAKGAR